MAAIFKTSQQDSINHSLQSLSVNIKLLQKNHADQKKTPKTGFVWS